MYENLDSKMPRFRIKGKDVLYGLVDAFFKATLIENRAIDFNVPPCISDQWVVKFDTLFKKFTDLLHLNNWNALYKNSISFVAENDLNARLQKMQKNGQNMEDYCLMLSHLHWLRSLGITDLSSSCGIYGQKINIIEKPYLFGMEWGAWSANTAASRKSNDLKFMMDVFAEFYNKPARPYTLDEVKAELEKIVVALYVDNSTPMANALLHYCNPDKHIHIFATDVKIQILKEAQQKFDFCPHIDIASASTAKRIDEIDEEICRFYDLIKQVDSGYDQIMRTYFYKDRS